MAEAAATFLCLAPPSALVAKISVPKTFQCQNSYSQYPQWNCAHLLTCHEIRCLKRPAASLDTKPEVLLIQWENGFISGWWGEGGESAKGFQDPFWFCLFETVSYNLGWPPTQYGKRDDLELLIFLSPLPRALGFQTVLPYLVYVVLMLC